MSVSGIVVVIVEMMQGFLATITNFQIIVSPDIHHRWP